MEKPSGKTYEMLADLERRFDDKLETKISKMSFWTVNGLLVMMMCGMFGLLWSSMQNFNTKIDSIDTKVNDTKTTVSNIEGKLEPFDFITE